MFLCSLRYCLKCYFSKGVYSFTLSTVHVLVPIVRKNYEDFEDLDEDVYCSIAVTKYMLYLGFNGVGMNPEYPKS